jgi:type III secretory pathway component EscV
MQLFEIVARFLDTTVNERRSRFLLCELQLLAAIEKTGVLFPYFWRIAIPRYIGKEFVDEEGVSMIRLSRTGVGN